MNSAALRIALFQREVKREREGGREGGRRREEGEAYLMRMRFRTAVDDVAIYLQAQRACVTLVDAVWLGCAESVMQRHL